jgi:ABC-type nickel/cobalt efflux system permease component RcnA
MFNKRIYSFILLTLCLCLAPRSFAHPMGNFSVNHYSRISLDREGIRISYIIDLAEIPTYQELQQGNVTADVADPAVTRFVASRGAEFGHGLSLVVDGKRLPLRLLSSEVIFPPGAGGLPTMKMGFVYQAAYPPGAEHSSAGLEYADNNFPGHAGWKEIVAVGPAASLVSSSVPQTDRSAELSNYPTDLLNSPPQDLSAVIQFHYPVALKSQSEKLSKETAGPSTPLRSGPTASRGRRDDNSVVKANFRDPNSAAGTNSRYPNKLSSRLPRLAVGPERSGVEGPAVSLQDHKPASPEATHVVPATPAEPLHLQANQQATPRSAFTELITTRRMSLWFLITAAFIALGLGALHALEPGHGKTIVAAYLVGSRGTAWHAVLLGLIVTASHTAGVFALGAITLYASRYIVPEQLYPWLGVLSGLTIAALGGYMFLRRWNGHDLGHSHGHSHAHPHSHTPAKSVSSYQLFALGITGGIIPCPAALVVLLSAFALHRIGLGFFLITAFSFGLAAVLIAFGMLMVYARQFMARLRMDGPLTTRWLPVASAAFMTVLGAAIALRAFATTGIDLRNLSQARLGPFLFVGGLGLLLGMRHSTDPDHVVAVSTIVSKQRSIRQAGLIGTIWGLGHTLTIFAVGSMIILFGVVIPPRLGLSMEFSVALMLILLGVLNLTGVMQRITSYLTRKPLAIPTISSKAETLLDRSGFGVYQCVRPLVIGIVHGLAGSAAVALLVLSTIHSPVWATVYLLIFGAGTMVGMMCMTAAMAVPLAFAGSRFTSISRGFSVASGVVSVCFGFFLVYQLGFLGGLFTSHPHWTPR